MRFTLLDRGFDAEALSRAAALLIECERSTLEHSALALQIEAKVKLLNLADTPNALICAALEETRYSGLLIGQVETRSVQRTFYIRMCCVSEQHRRRGVGATLMNFALREAKARVASLAAIARPLHPASESFLRALHFVLDDDAVRLERGLFD